MLVMLMLISMLDLMLVLISTAVDASNVVTGRLSPVIQNPYRPPRPPASSSKLGSDTNMSISMLMLRLPRLFAQGVFFRFCCFAVAVIHTSLKYCSYDHPDFRRLYRHPPPLPPTPTLMRVSCISVNPSAQASTP